MSEAKQGIVDQFTKHGRTVTGVHDLRVRDGGGGLGTLASITGGTLSAERIEIVAATGPFGAECIVIPFDGHSVLPGEYHLTLPGALRTPVEYLRRMGGTWNAGDDKEMAGWLKKQKFPTYLLPDELKQGLTKVKIERVLQLVPVGLQKSTLVFTLGGNHTQVQLEPYIEVATKLAEAIGASAGPGPLAPLGEIRFGAVVAAVLAGELEGEPAGVVPHASGNAVSERPSPVAAAGDVTAPLRAALDPLTDKRVLLAPIDDKSLGNIVKKVAKGEASEAVIAFLDTGMRASGKAGWAFTAETLYISEIGENRTIRYADIRSFGRTKSKVKMETKLTGAITCDVFNVEEAVIPALEAVTGLTATD